MIGKVLISVTDKTGIEKFGNLVKYCQGIISTGGTSTALEQAGVPHVQVEEVTNFPEMMGGRLKTLHPKIFGGILADRTESQHLEAIRLHDIELIDLVVVNLYDFAGRPGIERIDIGGPSLVRAAGKNYDSVTVVCDPTYYDLVIAQIIKEGNTTLELRRALAAMAFEHTAEYDKLISQWFRSGFDGTHPSHQTQFFDASVYNEMCNNCGAVDQVPGGLDRLVYPCSKSMVVG